MSIFDPNRWFLTSCISDSSAFTGYALPQRPLRPRLSPWRKSRSLLIIVQCSHVLHACDIYVYILYYTYIYIYIYYIIIYSTECKTLWHFLIQDIVWLSIGRRSLCHGYKNNHKVNLKVCSYTLSPTCTFGPFAIRCHLRAS